MSEIKNNETNRKERPLRKSEKIVYIAIIFLLAIAIISVSVLVLYPKLAGRPDWHIKAFFDLNNDQWIEEMVEQRIEPTGKTLEITSSFVYSQDTAFINAVYGSNTTIADAKEYYLKMIPGSVDHKEESVSGMEIYGSINGENIEIRNYEADVMNAYDTKITIKSEMASFLRKKLTEAYPEKLVAGYPELALISQNELLGGYVMYNDNELSSHSYPGVPIFSRAYRHYGDKRDIIELQLSLKEQYSYSLYFEDIDSLYFMDNGHIFSLTLTESDMNLLAAITVQKIPEDELAKMIFN